MKTIARNALAALALSLAAAPAAAQESGAFIVRLGRDTVVVDQFTRTGNRIEGMLVGRTPRTSVRTYTATLRPDGTIERVEITTRPQPGTPAQTVTITTGADSAEWRIARGDSVRSGRVAAGSDAFPWVFNAYALAEPLIAAARARGVDSAAVPVVSAGARQAGTVSIIRHGADSVLIRAANGVTRARLDARGRVLGAHSPESTFKAEVERVASVDANAIATAWAARDQAGQQMGTLSPRDSVTAAFQSANVSVAYGRPSMRGRRIMGQVVPWGQVWRTGANEATRFIIDRDVMIGQTRVPAGTYSIWTIPGEREWTLILNRQSGQWGTEYHPEQDFARIPIRAETVSGEPVEQLTMRLEPSGNGGVLRISWENTRVDVPVAVVP